MKINDKEIMLNKNLGPYGSYLYDKEFNRSITNDLWELSGKGGKSEMKLDSMTLYRILFLMGDYITKIEFTEFLKTLPEDFNILLYIDEIFEKAQKSYLPFESPKKTKSEE